MHVKTYRWAIFPGLSLLTRRTGSALETRVTTTARWARITTSALGTIFARSTWWASGAWVTLEEK